MRNSLPYMECYHPQEKVWIRLRDLPMPRSGLTSCVVQGLFYAIGGRNNNPDGNYDLATCDRWASHYSMHSLHMICVFLLMVVIIRVPMQNLRKGGNGFYMHKIVA